MTIEELKKLIAGGETLGENVALEFKERCRKGFDK